MPIQIDKVGNSHLAFRTDPLPWVADYYNCCLNQVRKGLLQKPDSLNVSLAVTDVEFPEKGRPLYLEIQYEHNLVLKGALSGENDDNFIRPGKVPAEDGDSYLIRIQDYKRLQEADKLLEYSRPNLHNLSGSDECREYLEKSYYLPPLFFNYDPGRKIRPLEISSNFSVPEANEEYEAVKNGSSTNYDRARRRHFMDMMKDNIKYSNMTKWGDQQGLYKSSKVVLNIRQSDYYHTLEEMRVLPALLCGTLVISEDVPLREEIPYHEYVIWSSFDDIPNKANEVLENYDEIWDKTHGPESRLSTVLNDMVKERDKELTRLLA